MNIKKYYDVKVPKLNGPYDCYGRFVCSEEYEAEHNYLAKFIEDIWMKTNGKDFAISFTPTMTDSVFLVNGKTSELVKKVIDEAIENLQTQFKNVGLEIKVEECDIID